METLMQSVNINFTMEIYSNVAAYHIAGNFRGCKIFVKSKTPELIFVVLNFVALDDYTRYAPFAIKCSDHHQSSRKRGFQFNPTFDSRRHCQQERDA